MNTEANPLNFPANASKDELNVPLQTDGSRKRRNGFDLEASYVGVNTGITLNSDNILGRNKFLWKNPNGDSSKQFLVIQIGNYIGIHDLDVVPLSNGLIYSEIFSSDYYSDTFSFDTIDGNLVMVNGSESIYIYEYDGTSVTKRVEELLIRDMFGVDDTFGGKNLLEGHGLQTRPSSLNKNHLYNLRNQTFALPRITDNTDSVALVDPIKKFRERSGNSFFPSNSDNIIPYVFADPAASEGRTADRYFADWSIKNQLGSQRAPMGYFIISATNRGASRLAAEANLRATNSDLDYSITSLNADYTPGGASVLVQYAGRIWYAGFSSELIDGYNVSPRMGSYLLFSQTVQAASQINKCYQEADPTSVEDPDLVDTDGGFVKIDGAYNIRSLVSMSTYLFVLAENGVWLISGQDNNSFTATSYSVSKISDEGVVSGTSVVAHNNALMYWGENAILAIQQDRYGEWQVQNMTEQSIQTFYDNIDVTDKYTVSGYYDYPTRSIKWLYGVQPSSNTDAYELIFNTKFGAFTPNKIHKPSILEGPILVSAGRSSSIIDETIVTISNGETVVVDSESVVVPLLIALRDPVSSFYTVVLKTTPTITYSFGDYVPYQTNDWVVAGESTDSPAYLITGPITTGDARSRKDSNYITTHFLRTENSLYGGEQSSCYVSSQYDWTIGSSGGKWTTPRQSYRPSRTSGSDTIVTTRNKVRGSGRSMSYKFESEDSKTFHLFGWEYNINATGTE